MAARRIDSKRVECVEMPDGVALRLTLRSQGHGRVVLVAPGIFMHRDAPEHRDLAHRLLQVADVATLDMRGHGDSEGAFTWGLKEPDDLARVAAMLRTRYARVGGLGFSFGGYNAGVAAARLRPFDAVALVAAPRRLFILDHNFLTAGLARSLPLLLRRRRRLTRLSPFFGRRPVLSRLVEQIAPTPLLIAHGSQDWLVPPSHARTLFQRAREPKELVLIDRGLHAEYMLADTPEPLLRSLVRFFGAGL